MNDFRTSGNQLSARATKKQMKKQELRRCVSPDPFGGITAQEEVLLETFAKVVQNVATKTSCHTYHGRYRMPTAALKGPRCFC